MTQQIVQRYFEAWTSQRCEEAYTLLASDLRFVGPTANYDSAEAFKPALERFAAMTRSARLDQLIVNHDRAAMLYDCELPPPIGKLRIASFFVVRDGKISEYETQFDATELRKFLAGKS